MAEKEYQPTTYSGKSLFQVSSAFQKAVRRSDEEDAVHWGLELYNSGFDKYAWKRMTYIVSEDIGLANPTLPATFWALKGMWEWHKKDFVDKGKDDDAGQLFFIHALMLLVRSPKCRICEDVRWGMEEKWKAERHTKEIPDYAMGMHTREGKAMGRGYVFFHEVEAKISPVGKVPGAEYWAKNSMEMSKIIDETGKMPSGHSPYARPRRRQTKPPATKKGKKTTKKLPKDQMDLFV